MLALLWHRLRGTGCRVTVTGFVFNTSNLRAWNRRGLTIWRDSLHSLDLTMMHRNISIGIWRAGKRMVPYGGLETREGGAGAQRSGSRGEKAGGRAERPCPGLHTFLPSSGAPAADPRTQDTGKNVGVRHVSHCPCEAL